MALKMLGEPTEGEIELYTEGSCHVFAIAMCQLHGLTPVVVLDDEGQHYESRNPDDDEEDCYHHDVIHVYAEDPKTNQVYDIRGMREYVEIYKEIESLFSSCTLSHIDDCRSVQELLLHYVDASDDRNTAPLHFVSQKDVDEAKEVAIRLFGRPELKHKPETMKRASLP